MTPGTVASVRGTAVPEDSSKSFVRCGSKCFRAQSSTEEERTGCILCLCGLNVGMAGGFTTLKTDMSENCRHQVLSHGI